MTAADDLRDALAQDLFDWHQTHAGHPHYPLTLTTLHPEATRLADLLMRRINPALADAYHAGRVAGYQARQTEAEEYGGALPRPPIDAAYDWSPEARP